MFKNGDDSRYKYFLKNNTQTSKASKKIVYPNLNLINKSTNNFKNFQTTKSMKSKKSLNRTDSTFLERNYDSYIKKILREKKLSNSSMINSYKLNSYLFDLRKYYDELSTYNKSTLNKIELMSKTLREEFEKRKKMEELKEIDLPDERVGVKNFNFNSHNLSRRNIEKILFSLINKKKLIADSLKDQVDYNQTLEYMLEVEMNKIIAKKQEEQKIMDKINGLKKYQKIIDNNILQTFKNQTSYKILNKGVFKDIKLVQKINDNQSMNSEKLDYIIKQKEEEIKLLEEKIKELKRQENTERTLTKNELKEKIIIAKEYEIKKNKDEKRCVEVINTLSLLQKFIYNNSDKSFDNNKLVQTKEYQILYQLNLDEKKQLDLDIKNILKEKEEINNNEDKYILNNEDKNQTNSILYNTFNDKKFFDSFYSKKNKDNINNKNMTISATFRNRGKFFENKNNKKSGNKTSSTFYQTGYDFNSFFNDNNSLNELIFQFNSIKITKNEILNHITNLISKSDFYRTQSNLLGNKEINLENLKSKYTEKVRNIITNNYFKFEELTRDNIKCKDFLEKNEFFVNQMKKNNQKLKMETMLKQIKPNSEYENNNNNEEQNTLDDININNNEIKNDIIDDNINSDSILFKASKDLIRHIYNFFLICSDSLKDIYITITRDKNMILNNLEKNENNSPYIEVLKKLKDFYNNKEIIIGDDYKLLLQYIKTLIKFCKDNNINNNTDNKIPKDFLQQINNNLIEKFYKPGEVNKTLDKVFIERFLAKKIPNYNNIFIHFTDLTEQVIENIKSIYNLIYSEENNIYLKSSSKNKLLINSNNTNDSQSLNSDKNINQKIKPRKTFKKISSIKSSSNINSNSVNSSYNNKFQELCEDDEDYDINETFATKKFNIKKKWKVKSLDIKITNKLYKPFLEKTYYLRQLNPNIPNIMQMTIKTAKANHQISKKISGASMISRTINIYNNPAIDVNKLCDNVYNSLVKIIHKSTTKKNLRSAKYRNLFNNK